MCAVSMARSLRADRIEFGQTSLQGIKIVDLEGSRIAYRTPGGELRFIPITEVERLYVDSVGTLNDLNEAERRMHRGDLPQAITHYERAVRLAPAFWQRLVRARLIQACDRGDRIDTLVMHLVAILDDEAAGAPLAVTLLPKTAPVSTRRGVDRGLRRIKEKIDVVASQSARAVLEMLRYVIVDRSGRPLASQYAAELIRQPLPLPVATRAGYRVRASALERWIRDGHSAEGLAAIQADLRQAPHGVLPELLLVKARALQASAGDEASLIRAAWAAMRVVIHYPDDERVPEALWVAAGILQRIRRAPTAIQLLDECIKHPRISERRREQATAAIDRLRAAAR